jgi:hypothetical protein
MGKKLINAEIGELSDQFLRVVLAAAALDNKGGELTVTRKAFHELHDKLCKGYHPEIEVWFEDSELHIKTDWSEKPVWPH